VRLRATRLTAVASAVASIGAPAPAWSPLALFAAGEQGAWYDPSDLSTMFQDAAGTTPVTAVEQQVGRILDKSGRGNHASQATGTSRPTLRNRYNLLAYSEQFDNAVWTKGGTTVVANAYASPDGGTTADAMVDSTASGNHTLLISPSNPTSNTEYTFSVYVKQVNRRYVQLCSANAGVGAALDQAWATFDLQTGTVGSKKSNVQAAIIAAQGGFWRLSLTGQAGSVGALFFFIGHATSAGDGYAPSYAGNGTDSTAVFGASLTTAAYAALPYQRIAASTDYDSDPAKFPLYLAFDGSDDSLVTAAIDFSASDKMAVVAGASTLVAPTDRMLVEFGTDYTQFGGWYFARTNAGYTYSGRGGRIGAPADDASFTVAPPSKEVLSIKQDLSGGAVVVRRNSVSGTPSASTTWGGGNYGNFPLHIGRRNNASLPFNGRIHQLIIRGAATDLATLAQAESWVAGKTGVTL
jgi:hypothetical protein